MKPETNEPIHRPAGVNSLREWGQMVFPDGAHKNETFLHVVKTNPKYASYIKNHPKLTSDWAKSFKEFVRAWEQMKQPMGQQAIPMVKAKSKNKTPSELEAEEWEANMVEGIQEVLTPRVTVEKKTPKRGLTSSSTSVEHMQTEIDPDQVNQLQTQIAILQRQLDQATKNH